MAAIKYVANADMRQLHMRMNVQIDVRVWWGCLCAAVVDSERMGEKSGERNEKM